MAKERTKIGDHLSTLQGIGWIGGVVTSYWPATTSLVTGVALGYLATLSSWINEWGPVGWGVVGVVSALVVYLALTLGYWTWGSARQRVAEANLLQVTAARGPTTFNRLDGQFNRQRISLSDLIHPLGEPILNKVFTECEFYGPGLMALSGSALNGFTGGNVELVRIRGEHISRIPTKAFMSECHLINCSFYNVVVAMTSESVDAIRARIPDVPVLGE